MRNANNGEIWKDTFDNIPVRSVLTTIGNTTSSAVEAYFGKMMGEEIDQNKPTKNLAIWCQTLQKYLFTRCGDELPNNFVPLGMVPAVVQKKVLKQKGGDLAKLVLPGGGDLASRIWAAIRLHM